MTKFVFGVVCDAEGRRASADSRNSSGTALAKTAWRDSCGDGARIWATLAVTGRLWHTFNRNLAGDSGGDADDTGGHGGRLWFDEDGTSMSLEGESGSNGGRLAGEKTLAADWTIGTLGRTLAADGGRL